MNGQIFRQLACVLLIASCAIGSSSCKRRIEIGIGERVVRAKLSSALHYHDGPYTYVGIVSGLGGRLFSFDTGMSYVVLLRINRRLVGEDTAAKVPIDVEGYLFKQSLRLKMSGEASSGGATFHRGPGGAILINGHLTFQEHHDVSRDQTDTVTIRLDRIKTQEDSELYSVLTLDRFLKAEPGLREWRKSMSQSQQ